MRPRFLTSQRATRVAFGVIIAFVTAQMAWWIYFQAVYVNEVSRTTIESLEREAYTLDALLGQGAFEQVSVLLEIQPHLGLTDDGLHVEVDEAAIEAFMKRHRSVVRMFAFEGPFFVLVVMTGLFIIARNLRMERELKRRQRNFLDAIGHEYKTPISTLRLLIETVQIRSLTPEKLQDYLRSMSNEVDRLEHTGQMVLSTARLEAGAIDETANDTRQMHNLNELVSEVVARTAAANSSRGAEVEMLLAPQPLHVYTSVDEVAIILENLVDNAIKYTPTDPKNIIVRVEKSGRWVGLSVEDQGAGIPANERNNVLERFYRVGNELTRTSKGLGLGLYLVRRAVEALGGRLRIDDGSKGGTLVTVFLPLQQSPAPATQLASSGVPG